jgi:hypothetical protein
MDSMNAARGGWRHQRLHPRGSSTCTFVAEEHADGFPDEEPRWYAYCPDCDAKVPLAEHEECPFYAGCEVDERGALIAFRCLLRG